MLLKNPELALTTVRSRFRQLVYNSDEAQSIQKSVLDNNTVIIVSTIATGRVDETEDNFYKSAAPFNITNNVNESAVKKLALYENGKADPFSRQPS